MAKQILQIRYYGPADIRNSNFDIFSNLTPQIKGNITRLGVQAQPDTKFYLNGEEFLVPSTGLYELQGDIRVSSLRFDRQYIKVPRTIIIDLIYEGNDVDNTDSPEAAANSAWTAATIAREDMSIKLSMAESAAESAEKSADAAADSAEEAAAAAERAEAADEVFIAHMHVHYYSEISEAVWGGTKHVLCRCEASDASCFLPLAGHHDHEPHYWAFSGVVGGVVYEARCDVDDNWILLEKPYATMEAVNTAISNALEVIENGSY